MTLVLLSVVVRKKNGIVFSGNAKSVTSYNLLGTFDILPQHTNFVSVISKKLEVVTSDNTLMKISFDRGVMRVKKDRVEIFLEV